MKISERLKLWLPYVASLAVFALVSAIYFYPQLEGRELQMHDVTQYKGMSQDIRDHKAAWGEDPQWEGRMFSGMPAYQISFDSGSPLIKGIDKAFRFMGGPAGMIFLAMASFWLMLLLWGINPWVGIMPSIAYGLSTYTILIIGAGHIAKVIAMGYAPAMIGAVYYAYRRNMWAGSALAALFGALEISAGHPQITYYFLLVIIALWINELVRAVRKKILPRFAKTTGALALAAVLAVGANLSSLYYTAGHTKDTTRGGSELASAVAVGERKARGGLDLEYATAWSYGKAESFNLYIPGFMGGSSSGGFSDDGPVAQSLVKYQARNLATHLPGYWGDQPMTAGPTYIGAMVFFLAILGMFLLRGRNWWWLLIVSVLALMLSWGYNFMWLTKLFFYYFPGYNKFRAVSTILAIVQWSTPLLAAMVLGRIWREKFTREQIMGALKKTLYMTGGVALFFAIFGGAFFDFSSPSDAQMGLPEDVLAAMRQERSSMMRMDSLRSLLFVILTGAAIVLWAYKKIRKELFVASLAMLATLDLALVDARFLPHRSFVEKRQNTIQPTEADRAILTDKTPGFRVANFTVSTFNDATTSYFHRSIGGYHGAKLQRYQDVIDRHLSRMNDNVYDMLNTRYFIVPDPQTKQPVVELNPGANGPAWLVAGVDMVPGAAEAIAALDTLDTKRNAVVESEFLGMLPGAVGTADRDSGSFEMAREKGDTITLDEYRVNYLRYNYKSANQAVAVFSEVYYLDGWSMYVDGAPHDYFRADYLLRAAVLPSGEHTIEFRFAAPHFKALSGVTNASAVLILLWVVASGVVFTLKRKKNVTGEEKDKA